MSYTIATSVKSSSDLDRILAALAAVGVRAPRVTLNDTPTERSKGVAARHNAPAPVFKPITAPTLPFADPEQDAIYTARAKRGPDKGKRQFGYANGLARKGISAKRLAMEVLQGDPRVFSLDEVQKIFVQRLFAASSTETTLSLLCREGKAKRVAKHRYCVPGLVIHR